MGIFHFSLFFSLILLQMVLSTFIPTSTNYDYLNHPASLSGFGGFEPMLAPKASELRKIPTKRDDFHLLHDDDYATRIT